MKLWNVYKKQFKFLFLLIILSVLIQPVFSFAETATELNEKINSRNKDIEILEKEIKSYQDQLDNLGKQKKSLNVSIKQLDLDKKRLMASIKVTETKIEETNLKIKKLSLQINDKQESIENNLNVLSNNLQKIDEAEKGDVFVTILSGKDLTSIWNEMDSISLVGQKIKDLTEELREKKNTLEVTRQSTNVAKNELIVLKNRLRDQKKIVDQNTTEKKKLLSQTKNNESNYQKLLKDRVAKKDAFEKELRNYESQLKYILDPTKLPSGESLSWPLDYVYITQLFGKTEAGKRLYANGSHNGVDFRASIGTPVKAMADGVVSGLGNTDKECAGVSFGGFVLIKYNNGLASTYGHLSLIKVYNGQKVSAGEIVGYSGNTGYSTGPHLHVSLYPKDAVEVKSLPSKSCPGKVLTQPIAPVNAYLDPMLYLPKYK